MATSGYLDTNIAPIEGASSIYPKAVRTTWNATYDDTNKFWNIHWSSTALGNPSYPYQWTTYQNGTTSFSSSYTMNPANPSKSMSSSIEKTRHNQELLSGDFTLAVDRNTGDASFTISMSYHVNSTGSSGLCTASQLFTLDNKPQGSLISAGNSSILIDSTSGILGYTITSIGDYWHDLSFGQTEADSTVIFSARNINNTTYANVINVSDILPKFPSSASGTLYFFLKTYRDQAKTSSLGTSTAAVSVTIDANASGIKPNITLGAISANTSPISGYLIAGYSTATASVSATSPTGASINRIEYTITPQGFNSINGSISGASGSIVSPTLPASSAANYGLTISARVYDNRGGYTDATNVTGSVYGYAVPEVHLNIYRTSDSSGVDPVRDDAGTYVYVEYYAGIYSIDGQNSVQSSTCTATGITGNIPSGSFISLGENQKAKFTVTISDKMGSATAKTYIYPVKFPLEIHDDKNGDVWVKVGGNVTMIKESAPGIMFKPDSYDMNYSAGIYGQTAGSYGITRVNRIIFLERSYDSSNGKGKSASELYRLPVVDADLSSNQSYDILTSKSPVSVAQGGTGATDAATARANLGIGSGSTLIATSVVGSNTFSGAYSVYSGYIVTGIPSSSIYSSCYIPKAAITSSDITWQLADESHWISFKIRYSGDDLIFGNTSSNNGTKSVDIYGVG